MENFTQSNSENSSNFKPPRITNFQNDASKIFQLNELGQNLFCQSIGYPEPTVKWKYNEIVFSNLLSIHIPNYGAFLFFPAMNKSIVGDFTCIASNEVGNSSRTIHLEIKDTEQSGIPPGFTFGLLSGIALALLVFALVCGVITCRRAHAKKMEIIQDTGLTKEEIAEFENGDPDGLIFNAFAHENARFQPYNRDYEIPDEQLIIKTDSLLGSGAFGLVFEGIINGRHTVAVKTLKPNADKLYIKALLAELKVMIYIGKHENVISLIGARTTELDKGSLHIVVEYCSMGSLESYIRKHQSEFINWRGDNYYANAPLNIEGYSNTQCEMTDQDLLKWACQIAAGMKYLASKKVIHGDLACRNILLRTRTSIKITDFGLSRQLYDYTNYVKKQQAPLPWRWLAIESLRSMSFSHQSDVWAFGVTLWELFSLGDIPYAGLSWTLDFVDQLERGLRLLKPKYCSDEMYEKLIYCWHISPNQRPDISELHAWLEKQL